MRMRIYIVKYCLPACLWFTVLRVNAQQDSAKDTQTKKITKVFDDFAHKEFAIANQYGDINIKNWNKPQIQVTVTITARSATKSGAEKLLERIVVEEHRNDTAIVLQSKIKIKDAGGKLPPPEGKCNIIYDVLMPADTRLNLKNEFGNINMGDHAGPLIIDESFGNFNCGSIKTNSMINLSLANLNATLLANAGIRARGFDSIKIGTIDGDVECGLSAGKLFDVGFANGNYDFVLKSDNIQTVNVHLPPSFNAAINLHGIFSTVVNKSLFALNEVPPLPPKQQDSMRVMLVDTTTQKQPGVKRKQLDKKIFELHLLKKTVEYDGKNGNGAATLKMVVYLSKVIFD